MRYPVTCPAPDERAIAEWRCHPEYHLQLGLQEVAAEIETERAKALKAILAIACLAKMKGV